MKHLSARNELMISLISALGFVMLFYIGFFTGKLVGILIVSVAFLFGLFSVYAFMGLIINSFRYRNFTVKRFLNLSIIGLSFIIVIFRPVEKTIEKLKSPVIFSGVCEHTVTSVWILFRKDNSFEYNAGAFLEQDMYYGKYKTFGNLVILKFNSIPNINTKDSLLITSDGLEEIDHSVQHHHFFKGETGKMVK